MWESGNKLKSVQESSIYVQNHLPAATFDNQLLIPHSSLFDQGSQLARVQLRNTRHKNFFLDALASLETTQVGESVSQ